MQHECICAPQRPLCSGACERSQRVSSVFKAFPRIPIRRLSSTSFGFLTLAFGLTLLHAQTSILVLTSLELWGFLSFMLRRLRMHPIFRMVLVVLFTSEDTSKLFTRRLFA